MAVNLKDLWHRFGSKNTNKEGIRSEPEKYQPILFVNNPISTNADDVIGFSSHVETINNAIEDGATMIGIIANYGTGKSSLTQLLIGSFKERKYSNPIKVNMWDSLADSKNGENSSNNISNLTKSFLFQLANGFDKKFGSYINKLLSKNYGNISFSASNICQLGIFAVISGFLFALYKIAGISGTGIMAYLPPFFHKIVPFFKVLSPFILVSSIAVAIWGIRNIGIAFSHWKMPNARIPEINDVFDTYRLIIDRISKANENKKQIIFIDDLDRINNKQIIIDFLKELYRFQDSVGGDSSNFVFIISVKPESELKGEKKNTEHKEEQENTVVTDSITQDLVYSKIFDATVSLKPIHFDDYDSVLLRLIKSSETKKTDLENLIDATIEDTLPESFKWIKKGENLTLRDLKDRLNHAISIFISLKNKSYQNSAATFESCAAVTYLESRFPNAYYSLIKDETSFSAFMKASYRIVNDSKSEDGIGNLSAQFNSTFKNDAYSVYEVDFVNDFCGMVSGGIFNDDYRMYFYTYPKDSHIKTTEERELCNCLLFPDQYSSCENLDETVSKAFSDHHNKTVESTLKALESFPKIILYNDDLFGVSVGISLSKAFEIFSKIVIDAVDSKNDTSKIWERVLTLSSAPQKSFLYECFTFIMRKEMSSFVLSQRENIIRGVGNNLLVFKELFISNNNFVPQITKEEIESICNPLLAIQLIDTNKLNSDQFEYISNLLNQTPLSDNTEEFEIAKIVLAFFAESIDPNTTGNAFLTFLSQNNYCDDILFASVCRSNIARNKIADYLNNVYRGSFSDGYYAEINNLKMSENLKLEVLTDLMQRGYFTTPLLSLSKHNRLEELTPFVNQVEKIISACKVLYEKDSGAFFKVRQYCYFELSNKAFSGLFFGDFPLICSEEVMLTDNTAEAISLISPDKISIDNISDTLNMLYLLTYTPEATLSLFSTLFDEEDKELYVEDQDVKAQLVNSIDYKKIGLRNLSDEDRTKVYSLIKNVLPFDTIEDAFKVLKVFGCFIPEIEEYIQQNIADDEETMTEYYELIKVLDELTGLGLQWLATEYLTIGLPKNMQQQLLDNDDKQNYVIAKMLFENRMILEDTIPFNIYLDVYQNVEEVFGIMSNHWDFLERFQEEADFSEYSLEKIKPAFKVLQHPRFYRYIDETQPDNVKIEYFGSFGKLSSIEDSKEFRKLVCKENNMKLLGSYELYNHIKEQLWDDAPQDKGCFTKIWNLHWKDILNEKEHNSES